MNHKTKPNLSNKRISLLFVGLLTSLGMTLSSFEYQSCEKHREIDLSTDNIILMDEQVLEMKIVQPEKPIVPPPVITQIKTVDNKTKINENIIFKTDNTDTIIIITDIKPKEKPIIETIFDVVEENAEFEGGIQKMYDYIGKNIKYPSMARETNVQGKIYVQFVVFKDGSLGNIKVLRGIGSGCDEEAIRVIEGMPKWKPGKQRNIPVSSKFVLPIVFKLN